VCIAPAVLKIPLINSSLFRFNIAVSFGIGLQDNDMPLFNICQVAILRSFIDDN